MTLEEFKEVTVEEASLNMIKATFPNEREVYFGTSEKYANDTEKYKALLSNMLTAAYYEGYREAEKDGENTSAE